MTNPNLDADLSGRRVRLNKTVVDVRFQRVKRHPAFLVLLLAGEFGPAEFALLEQVKAEISRGIKAPCTGCGYCMPCPKGVDIPGTFRCYNEMFTEGRAVGRKEYWQVISLRQQPAFASQCVGCGKCEAHCPQHLPIRQLLKDADKALRPLPYRAAAAAARRFLFGRRAK